MKKDKIYTNRFILILFLVIFIILAAGVVSAFPQSDTTNQSTSHNPVVTKTYSPETYTYTQKNFNYTPKTFPSRIKTPVVQPIKSPTTRPTDLPVVQPTKAPPIRPLKPPVIQPIKTPITLPIKTPVVQPTKSPPSPEVQQLVQNLKGDYQTSMAAREKLVQIGPSTIDAILPLLRQQDYYVRFAAADTLRRLNYIPASPEELAYYIVGLREYDTGLYIENFNKLVAANSAAVDPLILVLKDSNWMKGSDIDTIEVLVAIGKPAVPKLIQALNDPVSRESAGIALVLIDDAKGRQAVFNLMNQQGVSLSYYAKNYKQIINNYDPYDTDSLDLLWLGLALDEYGTKEMAEFYVNSGSTLYDFGEKWANSHGYRITFKWL
ncbi:MAG TPA: hypothetical protein PLU94_04010 [Methanoregulaceae archaeon]|nr:hypothetical protein [Methanoregulaceae archaeon]